MDVWSYENEYRIIRSGFYADERAITQTFKFSPDQLKGIIFGINTCLTDKADVIATVKKTYGSLNAVKWYQAEYNESEQKIEILPKVLGIN